MTNGSSENYYQQDEVSLKKILIFLYKGKWFFLVILSLVAIITYFYLKTIVPSYEASITYRMPSERSVSVINNLRFRDETIIPDPSDGLTKKDIYEMFNHKVFSSSFRENVFRDYEYFEKLNSNETNETLLIKDFIEKVRLNKNQNVTFANSSTIYMRGSKPSILSDFLNDLIFEANKSTKEDLEEIAMNHVDNKIKAITFQQNKEIDIAKASHFQEIEALKNELSIAKSINNQEIDFDKVSLVYQNEALFSADRLDVVLAERRSRSEIFPLWYFFGEKFIQQEIDKLSSLKNFSTKNLISLNASKKVLESFKIDLTGIDIKAADITWSVVPTTPHEPKKRLIMLSALFIAFLISIFLWYVIEIFRGSKDA